MLQLYNDDETGHEADCASYRLEVQSKTLFTDAWTQKLARKIMIYALILSPKSLLYMHV